MHHTPNAISTQQRLIHSLRAESDCLSTFNMLTSDILFDEVERHLPAHRERLFPPTETLATFIAQAMNIDRSCQNAVNQAAIHR
ncbi:MAG: hypothetical protein AAES65_18410 [Candidatus Thiodiazotropha sp. (ex. Lucinoma kazani)]